jgi:hypothetical protein
MILIYWAGEKHQNKTRGSVIEANKDAGLEENAEETGYIFMSCSQNVGHHNLMIAEKFLGNMGKFKCLGTSITNQIAFPKKLREN